MSYPLNGSMPGPEAEALAEREMAARWAVAYQWARDKVLRWRVAVEFASFAAEFTGPVDLDEAWAIFEKGPHS